MKTLSFFKAMNTPNLMKRRMWRYLGPVIGFASLINVSKFFEAYVTTREDGSFTIEVTPLRRNTTYSAITNWIRLIFLSSLPILVILFFNLKVYRDVRERSQRAFDSRAARMATLRAGFSKVK
jgi:hypothetical protein